MTRGTDAAGRVRTPPDRSGGRDDRAGERAGQRRVPETVAPAGSSNTAPVAAEQQRRAVPRGSRARGNNPTTGRAVLRDGRRGTIVTPRTRVFNNYYYYYPRRYYPYGYGAFGLGYFYYDPYRWYGYYPHYYGGYYGPRYYGSVYYGGSGYGASGYGYYTGELRLQVRPRHAEVYVDGYFAGHVDDFDGTFQGLRLEEGPYRIEIVAPGYETLEFEVRILPGRKTTYRGELRPLP